jgi:hypothetical protein
MANITYLSNQAGFPVDDNPGGDTPTGTVEWHDSLYYNYYQGYTSAALTDYATSLNGFLQLPNSNRLLFDYGFTFSYRGYAQRAYDVRDLDATFISSQTVAIVAPWSIENDNTMAVPWAHEGHDKVIFVGQDFPYGSNKAKILAVDVDTGLYYSSLTFEQVSAATGATVSDLSSNHASEYLQVSPDGTKIITRMTTRVGSNVHERLYEVTQDASGLTGLRLLTGTGATPWGTGSKNVVNCTNTRFLVEQWETFGGNGMTIHDINDGTLISTVAPPAGKLWFGLSFPLASVVKGNFLYFVSTVGATGAAASAAGLQLFKLNMNTGIIVGTWDISSPPVQSGFTPGIEPSLTDPYLFGMTFTPGGTLYLNYSGDTQNLGLAPWGSSSYLMRNRIFRCTLS